MERWNGRRKDDEGWESERFAWDPNISNMWRDVSLLWVSLIIMRLHADCTVLHLWGSKRIKALEVFCGWPWREVLGCVTAAFSSSLSSAARLCNRASLLLPDVRVSHWFQFPAGATFREVQKGTGRLDCCESKAQTELLAWDTWDPRTAEYSGNRSLLLFVSFCLGLSTGIFL